ncbi:MAG: N-6 DNA methylase, partial [Caldilineaceae bacterium]
LFAVRFGCKVVVRSRAQIDSRAGVVVPNGTLFADGVAARIKEELLREFNLHTIVRLPKGVFSPYTDIPTNILFFDRSGPTTEIWYYSIPLPEGRRQYTKTKPITHEDFSLCLAWWPMKQRIENEYAWRVPVTDVLRYGSSGQLLSANLDVTNPSTNVDTMHSDPDDLIAAILEKELEIVQLLEEIKVAMKESA